MLKKRKKRDINEKKRKKTVFDVYREGRGGSGEEVGSSSFAL